MSLVAMLVKKLKAMRQGPEWWQTFLSAAIAIVNVRFFYFKRPALLAGFVATVTIVLTAILAFIIHHQSCTTLRQTVPLPFVDEQIGSDSTCRPMIELDAWLKSDWVSFTSGNFSKQQTGLYNNNFSEWRQWAPVLQTIISPPFAAGGFVGYRHTCIMFHVLVHHAGCMPQPEASLSSRFQLTHILAD
jgi:hypothetical protein